MNTIPIDTVAFMACAVLERRSTQRKATSGNERKAIKTAIDEIKYASDRIRRYGAFYATSRTANLIDVALMLAWFAGEDDAKIALSQSCRIMADWESSHDVPISYLKAFLAVASLDPDDPFRDRVYGPAFEMLRSYMATLTTQKAIDDACQFAIALARGDEVVIPDDPMAVEYAHIAKAHQGHDDFYPYIADSLGFVGVPAQK